MSTRPRAWGSLAKCSVAVGSVSCTTDDTELFLASSKGRQGDELRALLVTVNAYAIIFFDVHGNQSTMVSSMASSGFELRGGATFFVRIYYFFIVR